MDRRLLMVFVALIVAFCLMVGCAAPATPSAPSTEATPSGAPAASSTPSTGAEPASQPASGYAPTLEIIGPDTSKKLTLDELKKMPATEGYAGIKTSTGKIQLIAKYKGVLLEDLCKLVGDLDPSIGLGIVAKDGYEMTLSADQVIKGDFITYDPSTGDEKKIEDRLKVIVAYERDGKPLDEVIDGFLRLMVVGPKNNQVTDGHWSVKWVTKIALKSLGEEWILKLTGATQEDMDRGTFESGANLNCHGVTWKDEKAQEWVGIPLYLLVGRVDDSNKHETGAYNRELVEKGYTVDVITSDGYKVTFDSARIRFNKNIIVAHRVNGNPLPEKDWPLRLVGLELKGNEMVGKIAEIKVNLPN